MAILNERLALIVDAKTGGAVRDLRRAEAGVRKLGDGVEQSKSRLDKFSDRLGISSTALKAGLAAGAVVAGRAILKFGADAGRAASDLNEAVNATKATFKSAADDVLAWGKTTADAIGISNTAALESANAFGAMFMGMGLSEKEAAKLSKGFVQLSGDVASFKNLRVEDALTKIQSGLAGEAEPLRRFGIDVRVAAVNAKALELGIEGVDGQLTTQQQSLVRARLIMDGFSDAQGDAAKTAEDYATSQRRAAANAEDFKAAIGTGINQLMSELSNTTNDLTLALGRLGGANEENTGWLQKTNDWLKRNAAPWSNIQKLIGLAAGETDRAGDSAKVTASTYDALGAALEGGALSAEEANQTLEEQAKVVDDLKKAILGNIDAQRSYDRAVRAVGDAQRSVADSRADLNRLLQEGAVDAADVARATRSLEDASIGLADAEERAAEARDRLNRLMAGPSADEEERAAIDLERAQLRLAESEEELVKLRKGTKASATEIREAELGVAEAQEKLTKVRADGEATAVDLERAELALVRAKEELQRRIRGETASTEELKRAELNLRDAKLDLKGVEGQQIISSQQVEEARRDVQRAERDLKRATEDQKTAYLDLLSAQAGDPEFHQKLEDARRRVADAERGLEDARHNSVTAALAAKDAANEEAAALANAGGAAGALREQLSEVARLFPEIAPFLNMILGKLPGGGGFTGGGGTFHTPGGRLAFHSGGTVPGNPSQDVPALLKGGEVVFENARAARGAGGEAPIIINMPAGSDGNDVIASLERYRRKNGRVAAALR